MDDSGQWKLPPDRPPAEGHEDRKKKKKLEDSPQITVDDQAVIMDDNMVEHESEVEKENSIASDNKEPEENKKGDTAKFTSYRASLMGFNGVAHCDHIMEEEDLFSNDKEICWDLPEESEEIKKLMEVYPVAPCTQEEYNECCEPWNYALILTVLGMRFNLYVLKDLFRNLWGFSSFELIDLPNNYFVVRFQDKELWRTHYRRVLYDGPWVLKQHSVLLQRWTPYFNPYQNALGRVATWIRVPDVPIHCYNKHFISRIGDRIGRTLKVYMNTLSDLQASTPKIERGKFVRICVELNLQKKLVPKVIAVGMIFNVEYEGLHMICFTCGRFGHLRETWPYKILGSESQPLQINHSESQRESRIPQHQRPPTMRTPAIPATNVDEPFGPWMLVHRRTRHQRFHRVDLREGQQISGTKSKGICDLHIGQKSSFSALDDFEEEGYLPSEDKILQRDVRGAVSGRTDTQQMAQGRKKGAPAGFNNNQEKELGLSHPKAQYRPKEHGSKMSGPPNAAELGIAKTHVEENDKIAQVGLHGQNRQLVILATEPTVVDGMNSKELNKAAGPLKPVENNKKIPAKSSTKQVKGQRLHNVVQGNVNTMGDKVKSGQANITFDKSGQAGVSNVVNKYQNNINSHMEQEREISTDDIDAMEGDNYVVPETQCERQDIPASLAFNA